MSRAESRPRWLFLFAPKWLAWHAFAVVATLGMLWLGDWQYHRAISGNTLSWAYTFEWPIFAIMGLVFWAKTIRDEYRSPGVVDREAEEVGLPAGAGVGPRHEPGTGLPRGPAGLVSPASQGTAGEDADDRELADYNAYLALLSRQARGHGRWHGLR
jgi:hypothetical protein